VAVGGEFVAAVALMSMACVDAAPAPFVTVTIARYALAWLYVCATSVVAYGGLTSPLVLAPSPKATV
jgi:hypothetical protein